MEGSFQSGCAMARINLVYWDNGYGLSRDFRLLTAALREQGCEVTATALGVRHERCRHGWYVRSYVRWQRVIHGFRRHSHSSGQFDLNIMLEHVWPDQLSRAQHNVIVPNPEWFDRHDQRYLSDLDMVWAKTRNATDIFARLGCKSLHMGFDSEDSYQPDIAKQRRFLHLAGASRTKGTRRLLDLWQQHPEWPRLTVVQHPSEACPTPQAENIDHRITYFNPTDPSQGAQLRILQNEHAFHVCTSETDAWGHYLVEAMAAGALTITVDAPPMNELVDSERGILVPYKHSDSMALATRYYFDEGAMVESIEKVLGLSDAEIDAYSRRARAWYQDNRNHFVKRVGEVLESSMA